MGENRDACGALLVFSTKDGELACFFLKNFYVRWGPICTNRFLLHLLVSHEVNLEQIAKATGLSIEDVENIASKK